jgi:hypothetical protein
MSPLGEDVMIGEDELFLHLPDEGGTASAACVVEVSFSFSGGRFVRGQGISSRGLLEIVELDEVGQQQVSFRLLGISRRLPVGGNFVLGRTPCPEPRLAIP